MKEERRNARYFDGKIIISNDTSADVDYADENIAVHFHTS